VSERPAKPLNAKAYGSIPHLPGSRLGPGDHHCHEGQERICLERCRDRHDRILVQEKVDGSCVAVAKVDGEIVPLIRAGYRAGSSHYRQHHLFNDWAFGRYALFDELLQEGERFAGEWLALAHGTRYELQHEPFVVFDLIAGKVRASVDALTERLAGRLPQPKLLHDGGPLPLATALRRLGEYGHHGALDPAEGVVYRVERKGEVDFLAKWVRPDKVDGCYFPEESGGADVWNWLPVEPAEREAVAS
jgi:hypothetical protein